MNFKALYDRYCQKEDKALTEILRLGEPEERDLAMHVLRDRHDAGLRKIMAAKLPPVRVDDALQETWIAVFTKARVEEIEDFPHLVRSFAVNKRADECRKKYREESVDQNTLLPDFQSNPESEQCDPLLSLKLFAWLTPFIAPKLSDCERIAYILLRFLKYKRTPIGRLMGKKPEIVSHLSSGAEDKIIRYGQSDECEYDQVLMGWQDYGTYFPYRPMGLTIERNDHCISPQFNDEELRPLGLTAAEFEKHYRASILIPLNYDYDSLEIRYVYLVFSRKESPTLQQHMAKYEKKWRESKAEQSIGTQLFNFYVPVEYIRLGSPEEYLVRVEIEGDNLLLTPKQAINFIPHHLSVPIENLTSFFNKTDVRVAFPLTVHSSMESFKKTSVPVTLEIDGGFFIQARSDSRNGVTLLEDFPGKLRTTLPSGDDEHSRMFHRFFQDRRTL